MDAFSAHIQTPDQLDDHRPPVIADDLFWPESFDAEGQPGIASLDAGLPVLDGTKLPPRPTDAPLIGSIRHHLLQKAPDIWGTFETSLYQYFDDANIQWFENRIPPLHIQIGDVRSPSKVLGLYYRQGLHGLQGDIVLNKRQFINWYASCNLANDDAMEIRFMEFLKDVLLHEMIHAYNDKVLHDPEDNYHGHGPLFRDECNRIGRQLGYPDVRTPKQTAQKFEHLEKCNYWPQTVCPVDRYPPEIYSDVLLLAHRSSKKKTSAKKSGGTTDDAPQLTDEDIAKLLDGPDGSRKVLLRLLALAKTVPDTPRGHRKLSHELVRSLRRLLQRPTILPHFKMT